MKMLLYIACLFGFGLLAWMAIDTINEIIQIARAKHIDGVMIALDCVLLLLFQIGFGFGFFIWKKISKL